MRDHGSQGGHLIAETLMLLAVLTLAGCGGINKATAAKSAPASGPGGSRGPTGPPGGPVPADFVASSVSFVSAQMGWVLGTATCGSGTCLSLVRTTDGARTWLAIPGPDTHAAPDQAGGVGRVRFADTDNGWTFGPELWATHDGGTHWSRPALPGVDPKATVSDLATANGMVHAAVIDSAGVHILTSPAGTDGWVASATVVPEGAGPVPRAQMVLQASTGWLIEVDRTVIGGARLVGGFWSAWQPPCADAGGPAYLAASTPTDLMAVCDEGVWTGTSLAVRAYASNDAGVTFHPSGVGLPLSCCSAVASAQPGAAVVADDGGDGAAALRADFEAGSPWASVYQAQKGQSWADLGFTSGSHGAAVAIGADPRTGTLVMTADAGHSWQVMPIR